jgi:hypothetical protein
METLSELLGHDIVDGPVPGDAALTPKGLGHQGHAVMRLALGSRSRVSEMAPAFICDREERGGKGASQRLLEPLGPCRFVLGLLHGFDIPQSA